MKTWSFIAQRAAILIVTVVATLRSATVCWAQAQWTPDGSPICTVPGCGGDIPHPISDGAGGVFIAWRSYYRSDADVYVQHVLANGHVDPVWPANGTLCCLNTKNQFINDVALDGSGGVFVVWNDGRNALTNDYDIYAQHVLANGTIAPGWPVSGLPICTSIGYQDNARVIGDGAGGAYIAWWDLRSGESNSDVFAQHVHADGSTYAGWPSDGLRVTVQIGSDGNPYLMPDGNGGLLLAWNDGRNGQAEIYAQHLASSGAPVAGWGATGNAIVGAPGGGAVTGFAPDGTGGAYIGWQKNFIDPFESDVYAARMTSDGHLALGWPAVGYPVCTAPSFQNLSSVAADGVGGVILSWDDGRDSSLGSRVTAMRLSPDGTRAPGWQVDGNIVSDTYGYQSSARLVGDGMGGAWVTFWDATTNKGWMQHTSSAGVPAPGWSSAGLQLALVAGGGQGDMRAADDGAGGVIVAWTDSRNGAGNRIYAQHYFGDGPTAAAISLASFNAEPDRVSLTWQRASGAAASANVYRRTGSADWQSLGRADFDGSGRLSFVDASVVAGTRYAYRLGVTENGAESFTDESWVDVPAALEFALDGLRPNPAVGELRASFSLARVGDARLALLDIAGRAVLTRDFDALGPGRHVLQLAPSGTVKPGVYWLRLSQANEARVQKAVVVR